VGSFRAAVALGVTLVIIDGARAGDAHAQSDTDRAAARTAATAGLRAYQDGRFQDAVDLCTRAESLMHAPTHLLLIARSQTKLGHLVEAQEAYFRLKRDAIAPNAPRAFVEAQASASDEQAALAPRIPAIKIALDGVPVKDVTLTIDGQSESGAIIGLPKPVNPGQHTLAAHASNAESETTTVMVPEGAAQSVTLTMRATAAAAAPETAGASPGPDGAGPESEQHASGGSGLRIAGWVGVGLGVAGAAVGTIFAVQSISDESNANTLCGAQGCPLSKKGQIDNLDSSASQASTLAWVSYGVGAAGLGAGIVMLVMSGGKSASTSTASAGRVGLRMEPWVSPGSTGVTVRF
jgi:hypothetical protein